MQTVQVFKYVISHQAFRDRDIILFFNKNDILIEKINDGIKVTDFLPNMGFHGDPLNLHDVQVLRDNPSNAIVDACHLVLFSRYVLQGGFGAFIG